MATTTSLEALWAPGAETAVPFGVAFPFDPHMPVLDRYNVKSPHTVCPPPYGLPAHGTRALAGYVSTDIGTVSFEPTTAAAGQYKQKHWVSPRWRRVVAAHNTGGGHDLVIDTGLAGSTWNIGVRLVYAQLHGAEGMRPHIVVLSQPGYAGIRVDAPNESCGMLRFSSITLPTGRVRLAGNTDDGGGEAGWDEGMSGVCSGFGDGYFPVVVDKDGNGNVERITVTFI